MGISKEDIFAIDTPTTTTRPTTRQPAPSPPPVPPRTEAGVRYPKLPGPATPPPSRRRAVIAAIAAGVACAGLLAYAVLLHKQKADAGDRAEALAAENRDLADALELHRAGAINLGGKLETCNEELTEKKSAVVATTTKLAAIESELAETRTAVASLEQKEAEFKAVTRQFKTMIDSGKLDVIFRRGQMIVKLPARILFASGSAEVSDGGKAALEEVAAILRPMRRKFTVAGHTDNVPISEPFKNNWELSAARAVAVVDVLIGAGMRPRRLVAAGFGPYAPIAGNRTARGRQINRRIEIILEPNLAPAVRAVARSKKGKRRKKK